MSRPTPRWASSPENIEAIAIDCWRAAQTLSVIEVEHVAANYKAIAEARDYLNTALTSLRSSQAAP